MRSVLHRVQLPTSAIRQALRFASRCLKGGAGSNDRAVLTMHYLLQHRTAVISLRVCRTAGKACLGKDPVPVADSGAGRREADGYVTVEE